jgi:hypothetical protein
MNLHTSEGDFQALIALAGKKFEIADVLIEKDYWVTRALKNLSSSEFVDKVVFKGGTSLSKAHKIIHRFSEDIDLAVIVNPAMNGNQVKRLLEKVEKECSKGFLEKGTDPRVSKGSKYRKTVWEFPKVQLNGEYGDAGEHILLEVNSFTIPEPHEDMSLNSLIAEYLLAESNTAVIEEFQLHSFNIPVLRAERTFVEKISALARGSYTFETEPFDILRKNIRHFYDLTKLTAKCGSTFLANQHEFSSLLTRVKDDDVKMDTHGKWAGKLYKEADVFKDFDKVWKEISPAYNGPFKDMLYGTEKLPSENEIKEAIVLIKKSLENFE